MSEELDIRVSFDSAKRIMKEVTYAPSDTVSDIMSRLRWLVADTPGLDMKEFEDGEEKVYRALYELEATVYELEQLWQDRIDAMEDEDNE